MDHKLRAFVAGIMEERLGHLELECPPNVTDLVFLEIENDQALRARYDAFVRGAGADIHKGIGGIIREHWNLVNLGRCPNPENRLIRSYEKHANAVR